MKRLLNSKTLLLFLIFLISLAVRLWLVNKRWINPDEGAHLMDAVLVLDGKIPLVDYHSRQPLYIYTIAGILKLFGIDYVAGRLLPLTCSMLVGFVIFLITRVLFDETVAVLATAIYLMLPLEIMNSVLVKTEPLVTLLICLSLYALILFHQYKQKRWLIITGTFGALGFYVRQSALIIPVTTFGFLVLFHKGQMRELAKCLSAFLTGYIGVLLLVVLYYSRFMRIDEILMSGLNPLGFLIPHGKKLFLLIGLSPETVNGYSVQGSSLGYDMYPLYFKYIRQAFYLHSALLIGLVFSLMIFCRQVLNPQRAQVKEKLISYSILYLWIFCLFVAYTYHFHSGAFYVDYCREFLPPLVIIFSAWLCYSAPNFYRYQTLERFIIGLFCLAAIMFFAQPHYKQTLGAGVCVSLSIALFCFFSFFDAFKTSQRRITFAVILSATIIVLPFSRHPLLIKYFSGVAPRMTTIAIILMLPLVLLEKAERPTLKAYATFLSHSIALGAFVFSVVFSANTLSLAYDTPWSPEALREISSYLRTHTRPTDKVMSGGVIWELHANRRPFLSISHPLSFEDYSGEEQKRNIQIVMHKQPPEVIILDGFTEKTYLRHLPGLSHMLDERYHLTKIAGPAKHPVKLYHLKSGSETLPLANN